MDRLTRRLGYHLMVVDGVSDDVSHGHTETVDAGVVHVVVPSARWQEWIRSLMT
jgi:hypothetical protein